jgi:HK97 family phage major capsid protein
VRIAIVDVSDLTGASAADLIDNMVTAYHKIPNIKMGRAAWYCNRTIATYLHKQVRDEENVYLTLDNVGGKPVTSFLEIPVRRCDTILDTEGPVS